MQIDPLHKRGWQQATIENMWENSVHVGNEFCLPTKVQDEAGRERIKLIFQINYEDISHH